MGDQLLQRLDNLRRKVRIRLAAYGLCVVAAGGVASFLTIVAVDWMLSLPAALRIVVAGLFFAGFVLATWHWIVRPLRAALPLGELAAILEARWASLEDRLVSAVNFIEHGGTGSPRMMERVVHSAERVLEGVSVETALTSRPLVTRAVVMVAGFVALAAIGAQSPDWVQTGAYRYLYPWGRIEWPRTVAIRPLSGDRAVAIGGSVTVGMKVERGLNDTLRGVLRFTDSGGSTGAITMQRAGDGTFQATIDAVTTDLTYWFEAGDDTTFDRPGSIRAVRRPEVVEALLTIDPPPYARGRSPRVVELTPGSIGVPLGGRVTVALRTSKSMPTAGGAAALRMPDGDRIALLRDDNDLALLRAAFDMTQDVTFGIELRDEHGIENHRDDEYTIRAVPDRAPVVSLQRPAAITEMTPLASLDVHVTAEDDFGIDVLEWRIERADGSPVDTMVLSRQPPLDVGSERVRVTASDAWDLAPLRLVDGDLLICKVVARDNRPEHAGGPQLASSTAVRVKIISEAEFDIRLRSEIAGLEARIRGLALDQAELLDDTRQQRRLAEGSEHVQDAAPGASQAAVELAARQVRIARPVREAAERFGSLRDRTESSGINDADAMERFSQLAAFLRQIANGPMTAAGRSLADLRQVARIDTFGEALHEAEELEQTALDQLRAALASLSRWGGVHELLAKTRDLAGRQENIRARTARVGRDMIGRPVSSLTRAEMNRLERLAREQEQLASDVDQLMARMAQATEASGDEAPDEQAGVHDALRVGRAHEVSRQSRTAAHDVANNRTAAAGVSQRATTDALQRMAAALQERDGRSLDELRKKLDRAQDQIAWLIEEQETLQAATLEADRLADADVLAVTLAPKQRTLKRNTRFLGDELAEVPQGISVADAVRRASLPMGDAESHLRRAEGEPAIAAQREAVALLRDAVDQLEAVAQDSAREALRRSLRQIREDLEVIAAEQRKVNAGIAELISARSDGERLGRLEARQASQLARHQQDILGLLAEKSRDFDAVVVFRWALERIADWMEESRARLSARAIDDRLARRTDRIVAELDKLIQAILDTSALPVDTQFVESSDRGGGGGADADSAQHKPVPSVAELLLLKAMQKNLNARTIDLHEMVDPRDASEAQLRELQALAEDQTEISRLTQRLTESVRGPQ